MRVGDRAPDFELPDQDGTLRRLSAVLADGPVALFFYPAALSAGCTRQACHFRDLGSQFATAGVQRLGISRDPVTKQKQFADKHSFDYPLLSDADGVVARLYGVARGMFGERLGLPVRRRTFAIGRDGLIVAIVRSEVDMAGHADRALAALA